MSTVRPDLDFVPPPIISKWQRNALVVGILGSIGAIIGWIIEPYQFYRSFLLGYMWCIGLTLGCLAILMVYHLTGGAWGTVARRILEAGMRTLPLMIVLFVVLPIGAHHLYPWSRAGVLASDADVRRISGQYLRLSLFLVRAALYFIIWSLLVFALGKISDRQDRPPEESFDVRLRRISGPGVVLYGLTITFASVDWVMSLDPHWASTIYGLIFMAGQGLLTLCFVVLMGSALVRYKPLSEVWKPDQFLDQGKLMMAFTMMWGWFALSQWLIIWAGNLPDEISWYFNRTRGGWEYWGFCLIFVQFAIPFAFLLSRQAKMDWHSLRWIALWLVAARYVDLFYFVIPNFPDTKGHFHYSWLNAVVPLGMAGLWLAYFFYNLKRRPLLALHDEHVRIMFEQGHGHEHQVQRP
jgi:hypothetical protein